MKRSQAIALALALAGGAVSIWISANLYERIPHLEDEIAFLWEAHVMAQGEIALPSPQEPRAFMVPFVIDFEGMRFGKYPPGWPAALSLGARAGAPWAVNALLSAVALWLIYRLGAKLINPAVGLLAELLALSSPMFIMLSGTLLSHMLALFLAIVVLLAWIDLTLRDAEDEARKQVPRWMLIITASLALGLLILVRPLTALGVALPLGLHGALLLVRNAPARKQGLIIVGGIALLLAVLLPTWQAAQTGDPTLNLYTLWWEYDRVGFGAGIGNSEGGHNLLRGIGKSLRDLRSGLHNTFGWPYLSWIFLPSGFVAMKKRIGGMLLLSIFPALVLVYVLYWAGNTLFGPRYYFASLPSLAVTSAAGIAYLGGWLAQKTKPAPWRKPLTVGLVSTLVLLNVIFYLPLRLAKMENLYNISKERMQPLEEAALEGALVIIDAGHWSDFGTLLTLTPPFKEDGFLLAVSRGSAADRELMAKYSNRPVFYYYADQPDTIYEAPRE